MSFDTAVRVGAVLLFACLVSLGYVCQAWAFREVEPTGTRGFERVLTVVTHPAFILGLVLSFGSTLARLAMFDRLGITQTVLAQELSVAMMLGLSLTVFRDALTPAQVAGGIFIVSGAFLVAR